MAEREGVEPSIPLLAEYTISSRAPSASRASLQVEQSSKSDHPRRIAEPITFHVTNCHHNTFFLNFHQRKEASSPHPGGAVFTIFPDNKLADNG
jgi:hypothetical protein